MKKPSFGSSAAKKTNSRRLGAKKLGVSGPTLGDLPPKESEDSGKANATTAGPAKASPASLSQSSFSSSSRLAAAYNGSTEVASVQLQPKSTTSLTAAVSMTQSSTSRRASASTRSSGGTASSVEQTPVDPKYKNAKSISSDDYFGGEEEAPIGVPPPMDHSSRLAQYSGASSISSDAYFNTANGDQSSQSFWDQGN
eukprot:FR736827.1.p1 GENE.FR736827.1~~FR736827.1.p1  ORF type:complete len:197 (+),score=20.27 FR736827.1:2-592(+)